MPYPIAGHKSHKLTTAGHGGTKVTVGPCRHPGSRSETYGLPTTGRANLVRRMVLKADPVMEGGTQTVSWAME